MLGSDLKPRSITTVTDLGCWVLPSTWRSLKDHRVIRSHPNKAVDVFTNKLLKVCFPLRDQLMLALLPPLASGMRLLGIGSAWVACFLTLAGYAASAVGAPGLVKTFV